MAINSNGILRDKNVTKSLCSSNTSNISSCRLIKINFAGKDSFCSSKANKPNSNRDVKSPYLTNDKVQLLSRVTEKKVAHKKPNDVISSFPLAVSVYKANSDEFKQSKRSNKKVKKSVLTLPNEPAPMPKTYTVSDLNDSEYFANDNKVNKQKRRSVKRNKKSRIKERAMEFYDRDAGYCSQLNIDLDCSSSEIVDITGDGERISKLSYKSNNSVTAAKDHDMWAVLRNINKFQFRPTPPESQESVVPLRKRRPLIRKVKKCNDTHFIETCHTEEFAYISSFEIDSKSQESVSPSSSFDRVTVIDKQSEQDEMIQQISQQIFGSNFKYKEKNKTANQNQDLNKYRMKDINKKVLQNKKKKDNQISVNNTRHISHPPSPPHKEENSPTFSDGPILPELTSERLDSGSIIETKSLCNDIDFNKSNKQISLMKSPIAKNNIAYPMDDPEKQINGITKVILSKGDDIVSSKLSDPPKKARLALTLPNTNTPKLTQTEIKRRLANMKFPIVVLGKDQITNCAVHVINTDPPHFDGLHQNIWPFMLEWSKEKCSQNIQDSEKKDIVSNKPKTLKVKHKLTPSETGFAKCDTVLKTFEDPNKIRNNNFQGTNRIPQQSLDDTPLQTCRKPKPISLLKNKVFQFLSKTPTTTKITSNNNSSNNGRLQTTQREKTVTTNVTIKNEISPIGHGSSIPVSANEITKTSTENRLVKKTYSSLRHPWAKGKWASDFIDNIIRKIRTGVYYGVDRREIKSKKIHGIEVSTQTEVHNLRNACCQNTVDTDVASNLILDKIDDPLKNLPGFDNTLTTLEIETIGTSKIAVRHCVTNVVVQFDIQVLAETKDLKPKKNFMSCIPINVKDNQEKVFKCNTSIFNASLPAELCSIIPSMMRNILDVENKLCPTPAAMINVEPPLTLVSEFKGFESPEVNMYSILPEVMISDQIRPMLNGRFSYAQSNRKILTRIELNVLTNFNDPVGQIANVPLALHINRQSGLSQNIGNMFNSLNILVKKPCGENLNKSVNCMALQPYEPKNLSVIPSFGVHNTINFMKNIVDKLHVIEFLHAMSQKITCYVHICNNNDIFVNRPMLTSQIKTCNAMFRAPISNVGVISIFNAFTRGNGNDTKVYDKTLNDSTQTGIQTKVERRTKSDNYKNDAPRKGQPIKMLRKKSYVKCYRKCNSMSSISSYKCTQLNKITSSDDFCQALGSNSFCSILDGCLDKRILGALAEMKNWITEINSKQALLILLLMNKKDTPNLIRFRPVLLQGIAVNRITRADELDTEIEVIERENFNKIAQYEGISYLPASAENQDNLLEELYWIAKTTASDYQKTFDESSEKLLKSLLEKRKKLNPSYLRVMARYVGLGLLTPAK